MGERQERSWDPKIYPTTNKVSTTDVTIKVGSVLPNMHKRIHLFDQAVHLPSCKASLSELHLFREKFEPWW
jgi:hypothetical protein